jgi:hypothetical protein
VVLFDGGVLDADLCDLFAGDAAGEISPVHVLVSRDLEVCCFRNLNAPYRHRYRSQI